MKHPEKEWVCISPDITTSIESLANICNELCRSREEQYAYIGRMELHGEFRKSEKYRLSIREDREFLGTSFFVAGDPIRDLADTDDEHAGFRIVLLFFRGKIYLHEPPLNELMPMHSSP